MAHFRSTGAIRDLIVEEDFHLRLSGIEQWQADGTIADLMIRCGDSGGGG